MVAYAGTSSVLYVLPLCLWFTAAIFQISIILFCNLRRSGHFLIGALLLAILVGLTSGSLDFLPYFHQAFLVAGIGAFPQLLVQRYFKRLSPLAPLMTALCFPIGFFSWAYLNILIIKYQATQTGDEKSYCLMAPEGPLIDANYVPVSSNWRLSGLSLDNSPTYSGGSGTFIWAFHALLLDQDGSLYNWSYNSQRFEKISDISRNERRLTQLSCKRG